MLRIKKNTKLTCKPTAGNKSIMSDKLRLQGTKYVDRYTFKCGNNVPIYEVYTVHSLNQLIGYSKFINQSYGNVYYRGEGRLHDTLIPSLYRGKANVANAGAKLNALINELSGDKQFIKSIKLENESPDNAKYIIEGVLQHYGVSTRNIDIVDNHWISLWMGLHKVEYIKQIHQYARYHKREYSLNDVILAKTIDEEKIYQYILMLAIPDHRLNRNNGIYLSNGYVKVDLRQALPSYYLRPHAQHGLVVRKKVNDTRSVEMYDLADAVVGIIKVRIDRANDWLGNGALLTQENLFPPAAFDQGYDVLLEREELFNKHDFFITKYV